MKKESRQDSLDGLIMEIFNEEIQALRQEIVRNLGYLIQSAYVTEIQDERGKTGYQLLKSDTELSEFIDSIQKK